jgi:hypothetical protein
MPRGYSDSVEFAFWGAPVGLALGIVEAMLTAIGATDYWSRVGIHLSQLGCFVPFIGAAIGYVIGRRRDRRTSQRRRLGRCVRCGYDLRGLSESRCPECGEWF